MEFRLNKVDPEVRQRVNETTSADKIHTKTGILINKDSPKNKKDNEGNFEEELNKQKDNIKKKISIEAIKVDEVEVSACKEIDTFKQNEDRGHFLDTRK
jgi:hypothetical protein